MLCNLRILIEYISDVLEYRTNYIIMRRRNKYHDCKMTLNFRVKSFYRYIIFYSSRGIKVSDESWPGK